MIQVTADTPATLATYRASEDERPSPLKMRFEGSRFIACSMQYSDCLNLVAHQKAMMIRSDFGVSGQIQRLVLRASAGFGGAQAQIFQTLVQSGDQRRIGRLDDVVQLIGVAR